MPPEDIAHGGSQPPEVFDVLGVPECQGQGPDGPGGAHPGEDGEDEDELPEPLSPEGGEGHEDGKEGDREEQIHRPHDHGVGPSSPVAGGEAEGCSEECGQEGGEDAHQQGDPDAGHEEGGNVPSPLVRSEESPPPSFQADFYRALPFHFAGQPNPVGSPFGKEGGGCVPEGGQAERPLEGHVPSVELYAAVQRGEPVGLSAGKGPFHEPGR